MRKYSIHAATAILTVLFLTGALSGQQSPAPAAAAVPTTRFVTVGGLKLEVLDFGGTGRGMLFLAALGPDAHEWDHFAPKFTGQFHVYAMSRRGFGQSDKPPACCDNYDSDKLGDDVLGVMDALKLDRPVLVGHSLGGAELSSVGSRFPQRVAGLVYLDAGYPYAFFNSAVGDPRQDRTDLRRLMEDAATTPDLDLEQERTLLGSLQKVEQQLQKDIARQSASDAPQSRGPLPGMPPQMVAIMTSTRKYTQIPVPILAIYALPKDYSRQFADPVERAKEEANDLKFTGQQADAFAAAVPTAHIVRIPHATHSVFESNEADVLREMNAFLAGLK